MILQLDPLNKLGVTRIGVDSRGKLIHQVAVIAASVLDSAVLGALAHGEETRVWGDSTHAGKGNVFCRTHYSDVPW